MWYPHESNKDKFEIEVIPMVDFLEQLAKNEYWTKHVNDSKSIFNQMLFHGGIFTIIEDKDKFQKFLDRQPVPKLP